MEKATRKKQERGTRDGENVAADRTEGMEKIRFRFKPFTAL